jgi:hypothetical protein
MKSNTLMAQGDSHWVAQWHGYKRWIAPILPGDDLKQEALILNPTRERSNLRHPVQRPASRR